MTNSQHVYEVRARIDKRGADLICDVLPFDRLLYGEPNAIGNAVGYAEHCSRSHDAVIRVYDDAGNVDRNARAQGRSSSHGKRRVSSPVCASTKTNS